MKRKDMYGYDPSLALRIDKRTLAMVTRLLALLLLLIAALPASAASPSVHPLALTAPIQAQGRFAVIDRSSLEGSGLSFEQLTVLSRAARDAVSEMQGAGGFTVLSEETTATLLQGMGVDLASCEAECERRIVQELQVDWLMSLRVDRAKEQWKLRVNLLRATSSRMVETKSLNCELERELTPTLQELVRDLSQRHLMPASAGEQSGGGKAARPGASGSTLETRTAGRNEAQASRARGTRSGIRNRSYLEGGYGSSFFYPRPEAQQSMATVSWGAGLRMADVTRSRYDLVLDWWRAEDDNVGYALLRAVAEIAPVHFGRFYPYARVGYQVIKSRTKKDERLLLGGVGVEYRTNFGLALAGGMDFMKDRHSEIRFSSVNRCWRTEVAWSGKNFGLGVVGLFGGDAKSNASISMRLRVFHEGQRGLGRGLPKFGGAKVKRD